ncbi:hypothetical protein [Alteromonas sp. ASW11-130]|uniref:hypothetical protein n=1 Tax=Alteromonas sp. ASW11-130 TaxID=3015775 RepID=UPI002241FAFD|nr:hypothetical protein [Alteromonas sp. ASW11-130]MCW8092262.1 hypothetical protein [Alteromonas sp. ASW11-130]
MKKIILCLFFVSVTMGGIAVEYTPSSKIERLLFTETGDVYVKMEQNTTTCTWGFYISPESAGYQNVSSALLAAYHSKSEIILYADETVLWSGSKNPTCRIYSVDHR